VYTKDYDEPRTLKKRRNFWPLILIAAIVLIGSSFVVLVYKNNVSYWFNYETALIPISLTIIGFLAVIIWLVPKAYVKSLRTKSANDDQSEFDREKERLKLEDDSRKTIAQIVGGAIILGGLIFTYNTYRLNVEQMKISIKQQEINQEGQITDRFTKAVSQIGSEDMEVRLGGLYALERIGKDSPKDFKTIMEIISSYIREKSPYVRAQSQKALLSKIDKSLKGRNASGSYQEVEGRMKTDIQTALTIIGRRIEPEGAPADSLDLSKSKLNDANLKNARFAKLILEDSDLRRADLTQADLADANLMYANLSAAKLNGANLSHALICGVSFAGSNMKEASLDHTRIDASDNKVFGFFKEGSLETYFYRFSVEVSVCLINTNFSGATLDGANFSSADLGSADFSDASLLGANFTGSSLGFAKFNKADLGGVSFEEAYLNGADLSTAKDLTYDQLEYAIIDQETKLPPNLQTRRAELLESSAKRIKEKEKEIEIEKEKAAAEIPSS
jgi:uncharacterized protein YjbI with pentapeptide repeats